MPITPKRMPFFDHIAELRQRLAIIAAVLVVGSSALYAWGWNIYDFVMAPITPLLHGQHWVVLSPWGPFGQRFTVAFYASIVLGSPIIIWQVMAFFLPALKPKERKYVIPTFIAMILLFALGVFFCYDVILGTAFGWIIGQAGSHIAVMPDAKLYFQGVIMLLLGFGLGFELPVVVFYLVIFNIVPYAKLRAGWRYVYVSLMLVASVATPDWSPWTMGALFVSLILLYELSMLLARVTLRKRISAQRAAELAIDED